MKYIKKLKPIPQFYASYGSFLHELLARFYAGQAAKEELPVQFLTGFSTSVQGERPSDKIVADYIRKGSDYLRSFEPFPYRTVGVEQEYRFTVDGIPFIGFVDYLGEQDGELILIDHKSRSLKPRSNRVKPTQNDLTIDEMLRQLYLYAYAVQQKYGQFPEALCFNCFKTNTFIREPFRTDACDKALTWARDTVRSLQDPEDFPPSIEYFSCQYLCDMHHECCYWQGR